MAQRVQGRMGDTAGKEPEWSFPQQRPRSLLPGGKRVPICLRQQHPNRSIAKRRLPLHQRTSYKAGDDNAEEKTQSLSAVQVADTRILL